MVRPTRRLAMALALTAFPAALGFYSILFVAIAIAMNCVLIVGFFLEACRLKNRAQSFVHRHMPNHVSRNQPFDVEIEIQNQSPWVLRFRIWMRLPHPCEPRDHTWNFEIRGRQAIKERVKIIARRRGSYNLLPLVVDVTTALGLASLRIEATGPASLSVLPDLSSLARFDALVRQKRLQDMGVARIRERGEGTEIAGLRPYVPGDPFSRIDWKATARRMAPVSREMHAERRQNIVLLFDCGRRMARESDGRSRLDVAIESGLLLAHVALRTDDRVGLVAFADQILHVVPPVKGYSHARALARAAFALEPVLREPPYEHVAVSIVQRFPRRSLLVLFTDAVEPSSLDSIVTPVRFLSQRHLVLCVVFRDPSVEAALSGPPETADDLFRHGAAAELAMERDRGLTQLRHAGALVLEVSPDQLSSEVINRYLEVKARHLL